MLKFQVPYKTKNYIRRLQHSSKKSTTNSYFSISKNAYDFKQVVKVVADLWANTKETKTSVVDRDTSNHKIADK